MTIPDYDPVNHCLKICNTCDKRFPVPVMQDDEDWPDNCPKCNGVIGAVALYNSICDGPPHRTVEDEIENAVNTLLSLGWGVKQPNIDKDATWNTPEFAEWFGKAMGDDSGH